jgi:hypothetical protein
MVLSTPHSLHSPARTSVRAESGAVKKSLPANCQRSLSALRVKVPACLQRRPQTLNQIAAATAAMACLCSSGCMSDRRAVMMMMRFYSFICISAMLQLQTHTHMHTEIQINLRLFFQQPQNGGRRQRKKNIYKLSSRWG